MNKLKYIFMCFMFLVVTTACKSSSFVGMPNPWINSGDDLKCAENKAGFKFPIELSNCSIRAMEGMIEIKYPLDEIKSITIRKSKNFDGMGDISGDYNKYSVNKELLVNDVKFNIRGDNDSDKIYVVNFSLRKARYAIMCDKGMSIDEILDIYKIIKNIS